MKGFIKLNPNMKGRAANKSVAQYKRIISRLCLQFVWEQLLHINYVFLTIDEKCFVKGLWKVGFVKLPDVNESLDSYGKKRTNKSIV